MVRGLVQRRCPVDVAGNEGVSSPEDNAFGVGKHRIPAFDFGIGHSDNIGKDRGNGGRRVTVDALRKASHEAAEAVHKSHRTVDFSRAHPAVAFRKNG